jgi:hypothetical protein
MNRILVITAVVEAATALALLVLPAPVAELLFGVDLAGVGVIAARVAGIALIALSGATWPGSRPGCGMLIYNLLATLYFLWLGLGGQWVGPLLWPVVLVHGVLTTLLARGFLRGATDGTCQDE